MTQNRRKRGFNDGTEDRSVAPYFQWKLKYGAIASSPQAPYPLLPREARKQAHSAAAPLQIKAKALIWLFLCAARSTEKQRGCFPVENSRLSRGLWPAWSARGACVAHARRSFSDAHVAEKTDFIRFALTGKLCETLVGAIHESPVFFFRTQTELVGEGLAPPASALAACTVL